MSYHIIVTSLWGKVFRRRERFETLAEAVADVHENYLNKIIPERRLIGHFSLHHGRITRLVIRNTTASIHMSPFIKAIEIVIDDSH